MSCPQCGYQLGPFEQSCPKCAHLAQTQQANPMTYVSSTPNLPMQAPFHGQTSTMPPGASYKVCPTCQQPAVLSMDLCRRCGYRYPPQPYVSSPASTDVYGVPAAPFPSYGQPGYSGAQEYPVTNHPRRANRSLYAIGAVIGILFLIGALALSLQRRPGPASGLFLIDSGSGQSGNGLIQAPAVDAQQLDKRLVQAGATTGGEIEVSLAWNTLTDLDIQVRDPYGELISASHPHSAHDGVQDVDANPTPTTEEGQMLAMEGKNPGPANILPLPEILVDLSDKMDGYGLPGDADGLRLPGSEGKAPARYTRKPVEHIYFAHAPKGTYTVYAHCYMWREPNSTPLPFTVQIRSHGKVFHEISGVIGPASYITRDATPVRVCQFEMR